MRVLALADKRPPMDPALMAEQMGVQAVVCLGDLDRAWIEPLTGLAATRYGDARVHWVSGARVLQLD
jgi:hypothetical protein